MLFKRKQSPPSVSLEKYENLSYRYEELERKFQEYKSKQGTKLIEKICDAAAVELEKAPTAEKAEILKALVKTVDVLCSVTVGYMYSPKLFR